MTDPLLQDAKKKMDQAMERLEHAFARLNAGRASTALVEDIPVQVYGSTTPVKGCANISTPDASTIVIAPWDRSLLSDIEKALQNADLGMNPQNDGAVIRLNVAKPTEEKRLALAKQVREEAEQARIAVRTIRQDVHGTLKDQEKKKDITEDDLRMLEKQLQADVDAMNKRIEDAASKKEQDLMTV